MKKSYTSSIRKLYLIPTLIGILFGVLAFLPSNAEANTSLTASCSASPTTTAVGGTIVWKIFMSGGEGVYSGSGNDWSFSNYTQNLISDTRTYTTEGVKTLSGMITSGRQSVPVSCTANVYPVLTASCSANPTSIIAGGSSTWTASPAGGTGTYTYSWSGTDSLSGSGVTATKTYSSAGNKTGTVTVTSGSQTATVNCSNSVIVSQSDLSPTPITYNSNNLVVGRSINFDSGVVNGGSIASGEFAIKWYVDGVQVGYGGHVSVGANTTMMDGNSSYIWTATPGSHIIKFVVDSDNGISESNESNNSVEVTVNPAPILAASCSANPTSIIAGASTIWSANPSGGNGSYSYSWTGTDSLTGSASTVSKSYSTSGTKTGTVTVTSGSQTATVNCSNSVTVNPVLTVSCSANPNSIVAGQNITWSANISSGSGAYGIYWSDNDGSSNVYSQSLSKIYSSAGIKTATARVIDRNSGQEVSANCSAVVYPVLTASCSVNPSSVFVGQSTTFTTNTSGGTGTNVYSWTGTDSLTGSASSVTKAYSTSGTKTGTVTVTSGSQTKIASCSASVSDIITIPSATSKTSTWSASYVIANGYKYYNPRLVIGTVSGVPTDNVPEDSTQTASEWCKLVPGKNFVRGTSTVSGDNPLGLRISWNGTSWVYGSVVNGNYPRFYECFNDNVAPVITAPSTQIFEATGISTTPILVQAIATDDYDTTPTITYAPHSFSVGTTTVTWTATDDAGNSSTINSYVVIKDTIAPSITSHANVTVDSTTYTKIVTYTLPTASDIVSGSVAVSCLPASGSTFNIGTTTVTCSATDSSSNTATNSFNIIVNDRIIPVITINTYTTTPTNQDITATASTSKGTLNATTHTFTVNGSFTFIATDNFGNTSSTTVTITNIDKVAPVITINPYSTSTTNQNITVTASTNEGNLNTTTHTFTANGSFSFVATDAAGNISTSTVTITNIDKVAPIITIAPYSTSTTNQDITVTASTNEGVLNATSTTFTANGSFDFVATDVAGNISTSTVTITNIDKTAPVITLLGVNPTNITVGSVYTDAGVTVSDNFGGAIGLTTLGTVNTNVVGQYSIVYTATDVAGNSASSSRTINVLDDVAPVIVAPINQTFEATGATTTPTLVEATSTDNYDANPVITYNPHDFALGTTTVTWTATDSSTNTATTSSLVTIVDTTAPVIALHADVFVDATSSPIDISYTSPTSTDLVDGSIAVSCLPASGALFSIGTTTVTCSATDASLNTATSTFNIILNDRILPVITIDPYITTPTNQDITVTASTSKGVLNATSTTFTANGSFDFVAIDSFGNTASTTVTITNIDKTAPVITIDPYSTSSTNQDITVTASTSKGTLNATSTTFTTNGSFTFIATDDLGNTASTTVTITNIDKVAPIITVDPYSTSTTNQNITVTASTNEGVLNATSTTFTANGSFDFVATDAAGNISTSTVTITNIDKVSPIITIDPYILTPTNQDITVTASTSKGTLNATSTTFTANGSFDFVATDDAGNISTSTVTIININKVAPTIYLMGSSTMSVIVNTSFTDPGVSAIDAIDGVVAVVASGTVDINTVGTYSIVYTSEDAAHNVASTTRTVNVVWTSFIDTTAPSIPLIAQSSSLINTVSDSVDISWFDSTDNQSGMYGYLILWDNASSTILSSTTPGVSTTTATSSSESTYGTYWFHVAAQDNNRNISGTTSYGPFMLSDSQVLLVNSDIGGVHYDLYSPTLAEAVAASTTGTTTITDSTLINWWEVNNSTLDETTVDNAILNDVTVSSSTIINSDLTSCDITNSTVKNYFGSDCVVEDSIVDPPSGMNDLTGSTITGGSQIYSSDVTYSVVDATYIATSTVASSTLSNSTTTNSLVSTSTINDSIVTESNVSNSEFNTSEISNSTSTNSTTTDSTLDNTILNGSDLTNASTSDSSFTDSIISDSVIENSTTTGTTILASNLSNVTLTGSSTISNSNIFDLVATDLVIDGDIISSGTVTVNGTTTVVTTPTPLNTLVNYAPEAAFQIYSNGLQVSVIDQTSDINDGTVFNDSWTYDWNFGDGATSTIIATSTKQNIAHTYAIDGTYTISLTVTDAYLENSSTSTSITVASSSHDTTAPVITLNGSASMNLTIGDVFVDPGAEASDDTDGNITSRIVTSGLVDTNATGTYILDYDVTDNAGNHASTSVRFIIVSEAPIIPTDTTAPVITLKGSSPMNLILGGVPYFEYGVLAIDNVDGDISSSTSIDSTGFNNSATGTYSIVYTVTDAANNSASTTRTVIVNDDTYSQSEPVITINGSSTINMEATTTPYVDLGATAFDLIDGDLTASTTATGTVDTITPATYYITYNVTNSIGSSSEAIRTVNVTPVLDITAPVITLTGDALIRIDIDSIFTDLGATAIDNIDGPTAVTATGTVNTSATGTYYVRYDASDIAGNHATPVFRQIIVSSDSVKPVIALVGSSLVSVVLNSTYTDAGATAADDVDGDITSRIQTVNPVNSTIAGNYYVSYNVSDDAHNFADTVRRQVVVLTMPSSDHVKPIISLIGSSTMTIYEGSSYVESGATAIDNVDGNLTSQIITTGSVNTNATGTYTINYDVTDSAGNTAITRTRTITVIAVPTDFTTLISTVSTADALYASSTEGTSTGQYAVGSRATLLVAINAAKVVRDNATSTQTEVNNADTTLNASMVTFNSGRVGDNVAPLITILGSNPVSITVGTVYADAGATSTDNVDGDLTSSIVASSTVNSSVIGTYSVIYTVTDTAHNTASSTRTVNVIAATTNPVSYGGGGGSSYTPSTIMGDINNDLKVNEFDFSVMMSAWGKIGSYTSDLNKDGVVDELDFSILMSRWTY